jgi:hypothetical protein
LYDVKIDATLAVPSVPSVETILVIGTCQRTKESVEVCAAAATIRLFLWRIGFGVIVDRVSSQKR